MRVISRLVCLSINCPIGAIGPSESFSKKFLHAAIYSRILFPTPLGGVAQLGERLTGSQEVRGSIPLVSTQEISRVGSSLSTLFLLRKIPPLGGVAQLGERLTGSQEVRGSIPLVSTQEISRVGSSLSTLFLLRKILYSGTFRLAADSLASRQSSTLRLCNRGVPWRV